jgi:hypothetical protein
MFVLDASNPFSPIVARGAQQDRRRKAALGLFLCNSNQGPDRTNTATSTCFAEPAR